jgi:hypothetical protein
MDPLPVAAEKTILLWPANGRLELLYGVTNHSYTCASAYATSCLSPTYRRHFILHNASYRTNWRAGHSALRTWHGERLRRSCLLHPRVAQLTKYRSCHSQGLQAATREMHRTCVRLLYFTIYKYLRDCSSVSFIHSILDNLNTAMRLSRILPLSILALAASSQHTYDELSTDFFWTNITATDELQYHECGGGFQCARLQLPLDWNATAGSPSYEEKFNMAIIRAPAQVPVTDPRYGGQIILNFGGPGSPATTFAPAYAQPLQTTFDAAYSYGSETYVSNHSDARYFDLIFFDPRGIPNSTPWYTPSKDPVQAASLSSQILALQLDGSPESNVCLDTTDFD